jgi:hypothetical protein
MPVAGQRGARRSPRDSFRPQCFRAARRRGRRTPSARSGPIDLHYVECHLVGPDGIPRRHGNPGSRCPLPPPLYCGPLRLGDGVGPQRFVDSWLRPSVPIRAWASRPRPPCAVALAGGRGRRRRRQGWTRRFPVATQAARGGTARAASGRCVPAGPVRASRAGACQPSRWVPARAAAGRPDRNGPTGSLGRPGRCRPTGLLRPTGSTGLLRANRPSRSTGPLRAHRPPGPTGLLRAHRPHRAARAATGPPDPLCANRVAGVYPVLRRPVAVGSRGRHRRSGGAWNTRPPARVDPLARASGRIIR